MIWPGIQYFHLCGVTWCMHGLSVAVNSNIAILLLKRSEDIYKLLNTESIIWILFDIKLQHLQIYFLRIPPTL